ncbi:MAG: DUF4139 domain-containing protein [Treponema sp.]|nr:DUF4139 domain-containing protein [Treponema sp.]
MSDLPVSRLTLFSSGVGFFEHLGSISGTEEITLPFHINAVNDALKSLVINDPAGCPSVSYPSEETHNITMMSLSVDINGSSLLNMLQNLKGTEIELFAPDSIIGRVIFAERRTEDVTNAHIHRDFLSIFTDQGIKTICLDDISNFRFIDPKVTEDLKRALDLSIKFRDERIRNLILKLAGENERKVSFSYVIPAAVWKASYRLNLSTEKPFLQGWAIVDNNTDIDWNNIELSLVTGKPVSFIQDLYKIQNLSRPTIPLMTEGIANAKTYDSGGQKKYAASEYQPAMRSKKIKSDTEGISLSQDDIDIAFLGHTEKDPSYSPHAAPNEALIMSGLTETAASRPSGDQFEFTIKKPVSLMRQQSAMLPLVEGDVKAVKLIVFSMEDKDINCAYNPSICVELTNNTGIKLPAGPITVYDGRTYAGDALIKFFPEYEKRLISYGEDLSVSVSFNHTVSEKISLVKIEKGFMALNKKMIYETVYTFRNAGKEAKKIIIEHPVTLNTKLIRPKEYSEKTHNLYRFSEALPPTGDLINFSVIEEKTTHEEIQIINYNYEKLAGFLLNKDITQKSAKKVVQGSFKLNMKIIQAENALKELKDKRKKLIEKQERTRKNIEAVGNQSQQGKDYLQRLANEDNEMDDLEDKINSAAGAIEIAKKEFENYLLGIKIK